ncbi:MAG: prepilin peptidase [Patescibacteria group bacterium]
MFLFIPALIFIFGLIIGSFLNVLILRLHSGESVAAGRSKCPQCGQILAWFDLVPVLSYVFLGGRCRYCSKKISCQYPSVELATGLLFATAYLINFNRLGSLALADFGFWLLLLRDWLAIAALIVIFVYDWRWLIIPDAVVLPALVLVAVFNLGLGLSPASLLIGLAVGLGFFAAQYFVSKGRWVGGGDLRLGALLGVLLGWPVIMVALLLSYIIGALAALALLAAKKVQVKSAVPFGVFLAPAALIALFWGPQIVAWYLGRLN